jgi:hypothetical protein
MEQLEDLMDRLNSDKFCAVTLYDRKANKPIYRNVTHEHIKQDYGTSQDFFEHVFAEGYTELTIQEKRKNGTNAFKVEGDSFEVDFSDSGDTQTKKQVQKKKKKKKKKAKSGLMGLGMTEIFDLKLQAYDRAELARKLQESEAENKELRAKNEALNEEKLQKKYTKESNDSLNNMLLGVVKQAPLILKGLGFNIPVESAGLSITTDEDLQSNDYSETNTGFLDIVKTMDDDTITLFQVMYQKITEKTQPNVFSEELFELLQKHQMIV